MPLYVDGTKIKQIVYRGTNIKKVYCNGTLVFNSDHVVTYQIKGQSWTDVIEDGADAITASATDAAESKMGSGDTFVGWTTTSGSTSPLSTIPCNTDGMILYGVWKHTHVGDPSIRAGCYQGEGSTSNVLYVVSSDPITVDSCGCMHQTMHNKCRICGDTWDSYVYNSIPCTNDPKHQNGQCTYPGVRNACSNGHRNSTHYAVSCGKSDGTFCG